MNQPPWYRVEFGPAAEQSLGVIFGQERTATGWPSVHDTTSLWVPEAKTVVSQSWESAAPLVPGTIEDVRGVAMKWYLSTFPPAYLAVYRASAIDELLVELVVIGVSFDRQIWESQRLDGLNE